MKKFSRCVLILILVAILSGAAGYMYENKKIIPMYESTTQLYVVPGEENEASIRADNGGLKEDFTIIFKSNVVISAAQRIAGTSENIAQYLDISSPANSNIVEIKCINPDQNTAKKYVDAVGQTAIKTTSIIPVKSIQILSEGTSTGVSFKPDLYRNTAIIVGIACSICMFIEIIVCLFISAFKSKDEDFNHEYEYERRFGHNDYIEHKPQLIEESKDSVRHISYANDASVDIQGIHNDNKDEAKSVNTETKSFTEEDDILVQLEKNDIDYLKNESGNNDIEENISKTDKDDAFIGELSDEKMFDEKLADKKLVDEKLSDEEWANIEIENQAAATIDEEESVEKVLKESAETFSADVADIQEASEKNFRIIGTIKK